MNKSLESLHVEVATECSRGVTFILAASIYWTGVGVAGAWLPPNTAFIASVWGTGLLFPLSLIIAKLSGINIFFKNALTPLGVWANIFQVFFFPIFYLSAKENIGYPPMIMGVLAGAHFVFYHWLYRSRTYLILTFALVINSYLTALFFLDNAYVVGGFSNGILLMLGVGGLVLENRASEKINHQIQLQ